MSLFEYTVSELHKKLKSKEIKVEELVNESYEKISAVDGEVKSFLTLNEEQARQQAKALDEKAWDESRGILSGMPIGVKDNIVTKVFVQLVQVKFLKTLILFMMRQLLLN